MSFKDKIEREVAIEDFTREAFQEQVKWAHTPEYIKQQLEGDYIPGLDDGEGPREEGE